MDSGNLENYSELCYGTDLDLSCSSASDVTYIYMRILWSLLFVIVFGRSVQRMHL